MLTVQPVIIVITEIFKRTQHGQDKHLPRILREILSPQAEGVRRTFPAWTWLLVWILVLGAIISSAAVCFLYSLQWGGEKSREWLGAIMLSFLQSVLLLDPLIVSKT